MVEEEEKFTSEPLSVAEASLVHEEVYYREPKRYDAPLEAILDMAVDRVGSEPPVNTMDPWETSAKYSSKYAM